MFSLQLVHHSGPVISGPEERDKVPASIEHREMMVKYVKDTYPGLEPVPVVEESCLYTVS